MALGRILTGPDSTPIPGYKMALAGSMAGGIAGFLGNPAELVYVPSPNSHLLSPPYFLSSSTQGL